MLSFGSNGSETPNRRAVEGNQLHDPESAFGRNRAGIVIAFSPDHRMDQRIFNALFKGNLVYQRGDISRRRRGRN